MAGILPQWLSAFVTLVAFAWAIYLYDESVKDRRKQQARFVYPAPAKELKFARVGSKISMRPEWSVIGLPRWIDHESQTALVDVALVFVQVFNDSEEVVTDAAVQIHHGAFGGEFTGGYSEAVSYIKPGDTHTYLFVVEERDWMVADNGSAANYFQAYVTFTDGAGYQWTRTLGKPVQTSVPGFVAEKILAMRTFVRRPLRWLPRKRSGS